jgi:hypothetical protein
MYGTGFILFFSDNVAIELPKCNLVNTSFFCTRTPSLWSLLTVPCSRHFICKAGPAVYLRYNNTPVRTTRAPLSTECRPYPCWTKIAGSSSTAAFNSRWHTCLGAASGITSAEPSGGTQSGGRRLCHHGPGTRGGPHSQLCLEQMTLPLRHGGLGLSCVDPALASAAYLAAAAAMHTAMREGPEAFRPFDGPSGALLRPQWEALHDRGAGDLWKPELREVNPDRLGHIAEAKGTYPWHAAKLCFEALLASYDAGSEAGKRDRARLLSCACRPASGWTLSRSCTPWRSRTEKYRLPCAIASASQCCLSTPRLCSAAAGLHSCARRRPCHAMPRPGRTAYTAPRHSQRDIAPCCAPGRYCVRPRTATSPSSRPRSRFWNCSRWLRYPRRGTR